MVGASITPQLPFGFVLEKDLAPIAPEGFELEMPKTPDIGANFNAPIPLEGFNLEKSSIDTPPPFEPSPTPPISDVQGLGDMKPPLGGMPGLDTIAPENKDMPFPTPPKGFYPTRHGVMGGESMGVDLDAPFEEAQAREEQKRKFDAQTAGLSQEEKFRIRYGDNYMMILDGERIK